ncbi:hypothetical protein IAU60_005572 [Kwoniella sp. DSM 27419]
MSRYQQQRVSPPIYHHQRNPYDSTATTLINDEPSDTPHHLLLSPPGSLPIPSIVTSDLRPSSSSSSSTSTRLPSILAPRPASLFQPPPPREDTGYRLESRGRIPAILIPPVPYTSRDSQTSQGQPYTTDSVHTRRQAGSPYEQPLLPPLSSGPISSSAAPSRLLGITQAQPGASSVSQSQSHSQSRSPFSAQYYHANPLSTSLSSGFEDRILRSPHPPLTATLYPQSSHLWPPSLPPITATSQSHSHSHSHSHAHGHFHAHSQSYSEPHSPHARRDSLDSRGYYLPTGEVSTVPGPSQHHYADSQYVDSNYPLQPPSSHFHPTPYLPPPTHAQHSHHQGSSPFQIPPPLRFKYSVSPPDTMPPRKKPAPAESSFGETSSTPHTVSSATGPGGSGSRSSRRLAAPNANANGKGWTMEHTYDSVGQRKEVIVIDDSTSPMVPQPPRKRTRAQVAAEQAQAHAQAQSLYNGSTTSLLSNGHGESVGLSASQRKRKADEASVEGAKKARGAVPTTATATQATSRTVKTAKQADKAPPPAYAHKPAASGTRAPEATAQPTWDDAEGHYIIKPDDVIGGRYKIVRLLGQGTFGKVVEARHIETRQKVAIKVIRAVQKYRDASKIEIRVLETLKQNDPGNDNKCIHLEEYFDFRNHPCLVSELYGLSVFDFLKQNAFQPFPEKHIQDFAKSLLRSVAFLHTLKLVHTDLKPENILLYSNEARLVGPRARNARSKSILRNTEIRLIDFGSATFESEYHSSVVSTRHYRAPEIILGLPWSYPCDMFSIGCILVEFYTGDALFQTHDNLEHLAMMEVVMGKFSQRMIEKGRHKKPEFFRGSKIDFPNAAVSKASRKFVKQMRSLREIIAPTTRHQQLFLDLCVRLLEHDPDVRIKVQDALRHPYLTEPIPEPA